MFAGCETGYTSRNFGRVTCIGLCQSQMTQYIVACLAHHNANSFGSGSSCHGQNLLLILFLFCAVLGESAESIAMSGSPTLANLSCRIGRIS